MGAASRSREMVTRPAGMPEIDMSRYTSGLAGVERRAGCAPREGRDGRRGVSERVRAAVRRRRREVGGGGGTPCDARALAHREGAEGAEGRRHRRGRGTNENDDGMM